MPPSLPPTPTHQSFSSSSDAYEATARVRVLVRVRPHNQKELTENGSIGRSNVLNIDGRNSSQSIDFNNSNRNTDGNNRDQTGATITVKGIDENDNGTSGLPPMSSSAGSSLKAAMRRLAGNSFGYNSDSENNANISNVNGSNSSYSKQFTFDAVHGPRSTQCEVYESVKGIVDAVAEGYNGTIVAYGQTGSGKTHTVFGDESSTGLVQRSLRDIFQKITLSQAAVATQDDDRYDYADYNSDDDNANKSSSSKATFHASFFEIFNERVYDLLANENKLLENNSLAVREDANGVYVEGLKHKQVTNTAEAEALLIKGMSNRHVASTKMNRTSSRSHAVFVLSVKMEHVTSDGLQKVRTSKFTLVDLAGSERQKSTDACGTRLKEASMINKSLTCLGQVINALVDKEVGKTRHVPFRDSKLTFLLRDTWGGNSKTCLVATVSPSGLALSETISTLKFAQRAKQIKNNAVLNEDTCGTVAALQAEVAKLRTELLSRDANNTVISHTNKRSAAVFDSDMVAAIKRRAERAEKKLADLEKQVSEGKEVSQSLKRKLQGETMVRKMKERRLDYLQSKSTSGHNEDQLQLLRDEIKTLQRKLETPSPEAIEWRVAYEEVKEKLENIQNGNFECDEEMQEKNDELEATIERLCNEKQDLEERLNEMIQSSNDTRDEIDSMINEVDRLEKEMKLLENNLQEEKAKSDNQKSNANEMHTKLETLQNEFNDVIAEKTNLEFERNVTESKLAAFECKIDELKKTLQEKQTELIEMETLSRENELELQCTIEELESKLQQTKNDNSTQQESTQHFQKQFNEASDLNESMKKDLQSANDHIQEQQLAINALEQKVADLVNQKESATSAMKKYEDMEIEMNENVESMRKEIEQLQKERENLEDRLNCVKEQSELTVSSLEEKTGSVRLLQEEIIKLRDAHAEELRVSKEEKLTLERKLADFDATQVDLKTLKVDLESKQQTMVEMKESLTKVSNELSLKEQALVELEEQHKGISSANNDLRNQLKQAKENLAEYEVKLHRMNIENDSLANDTIKSLEASKLQLEANIKNLQTEQSQNLLRIKDLENELEQRNLDFQSLQEKKEMADSEFCEVKAVKENEIAEAYQQLSAMASQVTKMEDQLRGALDSKREVDDLLDKAMQELKQKEIDLNKLCLERDNLLCSIKDYENSLTSMKNSHETRINQLLDENQCLQSEMAQRNKSSEKSSAMREDLELRIKDLELKLSEAEEASRVKIVELQSSLDEQESSTDNNIQEYEALIQTRDLELSELEKNFTALKSDFSQLQKLHNILLTTEEDTKQKLQTQRDRVVLLQREKRQLEVERDNLRDDQDSLHEQVRNLSRENKALLLDKESLKKTIENMNNERGLADTRSRESTFGIDSNLSYDNLSTDMDSMLDKMSANKTIEEQQEEDEDPEPMEESFDESMFLPNVANDVKENETADTKGIENHHSPIKSECEVAPTKENVPTVTLDDKENQPVDASVIENHHSPIKSECEAAPSKDDVPKVTYDEKENEPVDSNVIANQNSPVKSECGATPSKADYGVKKVRRSQRKKKETPQRAPLRSLRSSARLRSKQSSQYMMFNNNTLFGNN